MSKFKEYLNKVYKEYEGEEEEDEDTLDLDGSSRSHYIFLPILEDNNKIGNTRYYSISQEKLAAIKQFWKNFGNNGPTNLEAYHHFLFDVEEEFEMYGYGDGGPLNVNIPYILESDVNENKIKNFVRDHFAMIFGPRPATKDIHLFVYKKKPEE